MWIQPNPYQPALLRARSNTHRQPGKVIYVRIPCNSSVLPHPLPPRRGALHQTLSHAINGSQANRSNRIRRLTPASVTLHDPSRASSAQKQSNHLNHHAPSQAIAYGALPWREYHGSSTPPSRKERNAWRKFSPHSTRHRESRSRSAPCVEGVDCVCAAVRDVCLTAGEWCQMTPDASTGWLQRLTAQQTATSKPKDR